MHLIRFIFLIPLCSADTAPNVVVIVADDLGYNDVSWHNPDIISPNMEKLAKGGIILENHYVSLCSASRSALLTGYHPIHTGMQHTAINSQQPTGLYTNFTLMSEYFHDIGYKTHMVGKWHLGLCHEDYLPLKRGFETFYGFYIGAENYYSHFHPGKVGDTRHYGYDFRDQDEPDYSAIGTYSTKLFADRAVKIIEDHVEIHCNDYSMIGSCHPMFLFLPFQSVHKPISEAPSEYSDLYPNIKKESRRIYSGMVSAMDDAIGTVVDKLNSTALLDNTIIIFLSDNGAHAYLGGNNYPLRGNKNTLWEGGTKSVSFIYSKMLENRGTTNYELFSVTDWLPTLLTAVKKGLSLYDQSKVEQFLSKEWDGIDQWGMLTGNEANKRSEILYNIDPLYLDSEDAITLANTLTGKAQVLGHGAIRIGDLKLMVGNPGSLDGHYPPEFDASSLKGYKNFVSDLCTGYEMIPGPPYIFRGWPTYLFDLKNDPLECFNIARDNPDVVDKMLERYKEHESTMIPPFTADQVDEGNPIFFNGTWSPGWCESKP